MLKLAIRMACLTGKQILLNLIDIRTREIAENIADPEKSKNVYRVLKINYCIAGRCELRLRSGECTYLTAGEIAVDAGQTLSTFYYPTGEYRGFEIAVYLDFLPREYSVFGECFSSPEGIYDLCSELERPWIRNAAEPVNGMYERLRIYIDEYDNPELVLLICLEAFSLLSQMDFSKASIRRTYCTVSQVEIAKSTRDKKIIVVNGVDDAANELRKIGNNLNQLTRAVNSGYLYEVNLTATREELKRIWQSLNSLTQEVR